MRIKSCVRWLELCSSARLHSGAQRTKKRQGGRPAAQTAAAPPPPAQLIMDTPVTRHTNTAFMVRTVPEKPSQYLVFANINTPRFTTLAYFPVFTKMLLYQKEDKFLTFFVPKQSYCKIIVGLCGNTKKPTFIEQSRLVSYFPSCLGVLSLETQSACGLSAMCVNQTCLHYPHLSYQLSVSQVLSALHF